MTRLLITIAFAIGFLLSPIYSQYDFNVDNIPDSLLEKANSVIRHNYTKLEMFEDKLTYKYDYAITALNKKHEDYLYFAEHYRKNESKIKDVKIAIFDAEGQLVKKIKKKEIKEYGIQDIEFADDERSMYYQHSSPVFPVTIHVTYRHEIESPYYIKSWFPTSIFKQAVEFASITITDHFGGSFDFQVQNLPEASIQNTKITRFECNQQKAFSKEKYMPDRRECFPNLEFSLRRLKYFDHVGKIDGWREFGPWTYSEMFLPKQDYDLGELREETIHLVNDQDSDLIKAQKLYKYIQETTRYVFISLEDGGWSPLPISTVHQKKYGDCKALSFYYQTLCKAHGIDATLALVNAGNNKQSANEEFYSSSQFNHVISKLDIEGVSYWVDCTSKKDPFNYLGKFTDDRKVLLISEGPGVLTKTPEYKYSRNCRTDLTYSEDGKLKADIDLETVGVGISYKLHKLSKMTNQELASYQKELLTTYVDPKIINYSNAFDTVNLNFKEHFNIECNNESERLGDHIKIRLNRNELALPKLKRDKNRVWPIRFLRNKEFSATTTLNHELSMVPIIEDDVELVSEFGTYTYSSSASAGKVTIKRSLKTKKATYAPERYKEIKSFFDKIKNIEKRSILISKKS